MTKYTFLFDLDGTVTAQETLPAIAEQLNLVDKITQLTEETILGRIPFIESFIHRVNLLKPYPITTIQEIINKVPLHEHIVAFIRDKHQSCHIVTGNLDCWIIPLIKKIGCSYFCSQADYKEDLIIKITSIINKANIVKRFQEQGSKVVFIGEGNNDAEAIRIADIGIAFGAIHSPSQSTMEVASHAIFDEQRLCKFLKQLS